MTHTRTDDEMIQQQIIESFEKGLLSAHGKEIRVTGAVRIGEPRVIEYDLRGWGYRPLGAERLHYSNGETLHVRWARSPEFDAKKL